LDDPADVALLDEYQLDDTLEVPLYRLRRDRDIPTDLAGRLSRFWEAMGLDAAGQSITEGEIVHGAWQAGGARSHALFYLRHLRQEPAAPFPATSSPSFSNKTDGARTVCNG